MKASREPVIRVLKMEAIGPFSWRWPLNVEAFTRGWVAVADVDGLEFHIRHGIGDRDVFGHRRIHSVTWVEGRPTVEGVEADDFSRSKSLLSLIKLTKRHLKPNASVPRVYDGFQVVVMADEASGPYSPRSLAVKLRQDDIDGWTRHALLRSAAWGRLRERQPRRSLPPLSRTGPAPASRSVGAGHDGDSKAIVAAILRYGRSQRPIASGASVQFTPNELANELLRKDSFAFLLAVIMDQGIAAERAWLGPYLLKQRLGHLDPERIARDQRAVHAAVNKAPKLHRYVENIPRWLSLAGGRVVSEYGGDATTIWSDEPTADELQRRFDAFTGIGQKKAAMAVEILERDLGVKVRDLHRSDIAYDVHLRRVFLRTRLAERDDRDHMIDVARRLNPTRPGALDMPTWLIGRGWCHPGVPNCESCPLTTVCPKDIERAAAVTST
jgi:uncharacterized HhH-GPD family protein